LGLHKVIGEHTGENIAAVLVILFRDYGIAGNIRFFMANNTELNNTCIDAVLQALYPKMSAKKQKAYQFHCFGHITNLCAQAFIIGTDTDKICKEITAVYYNQNYSKIQKLWKKQGPVGLLQNLIQYIHMTPQRHGFFRRIQMGGPLSEFDSLEVHDRAIVLRFATQQNIR